MNLDDTAILQTNNIDQHCIYISDVLDKWETNSVGATGGKLPMMLLHSSGMHFAIPE